MNAPDSITGKPHRLGWRILDWDSLTAFKEASLEDVKQDV